MVNSTRVSNYRKIFLCDNWLEYYLYPLGMLLLGSWSLSVSGAVFFSLYCIVAALLLAITPWIFRLPIKYRSRVIRFCSYGQLVLAGFCIVLLLALSPSPVQAQFLNNAETWLKSVMPQSIHGALTLGVNAVRAVFIYYAGTKLTEAYRESRGEGTAEFMTLAREPIRGGLIIAIGDLVVLLFTGTGGTT